MLEVPTRVQKHTRTDGLAYTLPCNHSPLVLGFRLGTVVALLIGVIAALSEGAMSPISVLAVTIFALLGMTVADLCLLPVARYAARRSAPILPAVFFLTLIPSVLGALMGAMIAGVAIGVLAGVAWSALGVLLVETTHLRIGRRGFVLRTTPSRDELRIAFDEIASIDPISLTRRWQDVTIGHRGSGQTATLGLDLNQEEAAWLVALLRKHMAAWQSTMRPSRGAKATRSRQDPGSRSRS